MEKDKNIFSISRHNKETRRTNYDPLNDEQVRNILREWYSLPNPHQSRMTPSKKYFDIGDWADDPNIEPLCSPVLISNAPASSEMHNLTNMLIMKPRCVYMLQLIVARWCHEKSCSKKWLRSQLGYAEASIIEWTGDLRDYSAITIDRDPATENSYVTPTRMVLYRALEIINHMRTFMHHLETKHQDADFFDIIKHDINWKKLDKSVGTKYTDSVEQDCVNGKDLAEPVVLKFKN